ncbi:hypothetical protein Tco_1436114, partial [Tanacetum coccineum]
GKRCRWKLTLLKSKTLAYEVAILEVEIKAPPVVLQGDDAQLDTLTVKEAVQLPVEHM